MEMVVIIIGEVVAVLGAHVKVLDRISPVAQLVLSEQKVEVGAAVTAVEECGKIHPQLDLVHQQKGEWMTTSAVPLVVLPLATTRFRQSLL